MLEDLDEWGCWRNKDGYQQVVKVVLFSPKDINFLLRDNSDYGNRALAGAEGGACSANPL